MYRQFRQCTGGLKPSLCLFSVSSLSLLCLFSVSVLSAHLQRDIRRHLQGEVQEALVTECEGLARQATRLVREHTAEDTVQPRPPFRTLLSLLSLTSLTSTPLILPLFSLFTLFTLFALVAPCNPCTGHRRVEQVVEELVRVLLVRPSKQRVLPLQVGHELPRRQRPRAALLARDGHEQRCERGHEAGLPSSGGGGGEGGRGGRGGCGGSGGGAEELSTEGFAKVQALEDAVDVAGVAEVFQAKVAVVELVVVGEEELGRVSSAHCELPGDPVVVARAASTPLLAAAPLVVDWRGSVLYGGMRVCRKRTVLGESRRGRTLAWRSLSRLS